MERSDVRDFRDTDRSRISLRSIRATHFAVPLRQTRKGLSISIKLREERLGRKQSHDTIADRDFGRPHGKQLWLWEGIDEGGRDRKAPRRNAGRGVGYWTDGQEERIFVITTGFFLVALDAKTGVPVPSFGANGAVDLMKELNVEFDHVSRIGSSSPPMVYMDTVIIPPALEEGFHPDSMRNTPGYVMAFDARSGKQKWAFHTVPT